MAGTGIAPALIAVFALAERLGPAGSPTEAMAFVAAGASLGGAIAATLAGWVADHWIARNAFAVPVAFGVITLAAVTLGSRFLSIPPGDGRSASQRIELGVLPVDG